MMFFVKPTSMFEMFYPPSALQELMIDLCKGLLDIHSLSALFHTDIIINLKGSGQCNLITAIKSCHLWNVIKYIHIYSIYYVYTAVHLQTNNIIIRNYY